MPFATLDQEALFGQSLFGKRVQADLARDSDTLSAENRRIEAELTAEELELTERRPGLPSTDFSVLAKTFDDKVKNIRSEQDRKAQSLQKHLEIERQNFLGQVGPVLTDLMRRLGVLALLDRNAILLAVDEIDITDEAIAAVDAKVGAGQTVDQTVPPAPADQGVPAPSTPTAPASAGQ